MPAKPHGPLHPVAPGIFLVIGVGRGHEWELQLPGSLEAGQPEGELGNDVDDVGLKSADVVDNVAEPGKGPLDVLVQKERNAGRPVHLRPVSHTFG
jgi:hypothetical protein